MASFQKGDILWLQGNSMSRWKLGQAKCIGDPGGIYPLIEVQITPPYRTKVHYSRLHHTLDAAYRATITELQARIASTHAHMDRLTKAYERGEL